MRGNGSEAKFDSAGRAGDLGEAAFAAGLQAAEVSDLYEVYYSLSIPMTPKHPKQMHGDVDVEVANGNTLVLLDVKFWQLGERYWLNSDGNPMKGNEPLLKGGEHRLSLNMQLAEERYFELLPGVNVSSMVGFFPPDYGALTPIDVNDLIWPGNIRSYSAAQAYSELYRRLGAPEPVNPSITALCRSMQRNPNI